MADSSKLRGDGSVFVQSFAYGESEGESPLVGVSPGNASQGERVGNNRTILGDEVTEVIGGPEPKGVHNEPITPLKS